ncbi:MAG: hypothetical protein WCS03_16990 [Bacteroidota bacterium]
MKSSHIKIIQIALILLLIAGCKKTYVISDKQTILFQFEYVNYAWGYQHYGFIIDNEGNVLKYSNPENWNFQDNDFSMSEARVSENISKCAKTGITISKEDLHKYSNYINNIASSKVTALKNVAADSGSSEYFCYQFSESTKTYKSYLIKKEGDFICENLNFYSKKTVAWMKDINNCVTGN